MKSIAKNAKDPSTEELKMETKIKLLTQSVTDVNLRKSEKFNEYWPLFVKSCLKYGLKPDHQSFSIRALKELFEHVYKGQSRIDQRVHIGYI